MNSNASPASVRQRLLNRAKADGEAFDYILVRYANERLLYRLCVSPFRAKYVLKGATLFAIWSAAPHRATRDIDLLGYGDRATERVEREFRAIAEQDVEPDGIVFEAASVKGEQIREGQTYEGVRIKMRAELAGAAVPVQIDIGFGDSIEPGLIEQQMPTLLEFSPPRLYAYRPETVIAEKFEAMVRFGIANTRMKDFHDIYVLSRTMTFAKRALGEAVRSTFERRGTRLPADVPTALTAAFGADSEKLAQWRAYANRSSNEAFVPPFAAVLGQLRRFLSPLTVVFDPRDVDEATWSDGDGWTVGGKGER